MELISKTIMKSSILSILGGMIIFLCTLLAFNLPGSSIPQTAQTFAVLVVAGTMGHAIGFSSVVLYLAVGVLGIPVFAEGTLGVEAFMGPTRGYLFGFIFAALLCGWWCSQTHNRSFLSIFSIMLLAHILILSMGWLWLSSKIGPGRAFVEGVFPFFYGALIKSIAATLVVLIYYKFENKFNIRLN